MLLDAPLQVNSSTPIVIQGDLEQRGKQIDISLVSTTTTNSSSFASDPLVIVTGTAQLNGTLVLHIPSSPLNGSSTLVPVVQAGNVMGTFNSVNITTTMSSLAGSESLCSEQQTDGRSLSVLIKSCGKHGTGGVPVVAIVVPFVFIAVVVFVAILGWYLLSVRRVWTGADVLWRKDRRNQSQDGEELTQYHRLEG